MSQYASQAHSRHQPVRRAVAALTMRASRPQRHREEGGGLIMVPLLIVFGMFVLVLVS